MAGQLKQRCVLPCNLQRSVSDKQQATSQPGARTRGHRMSNWSRGTASSGTHDGGRSGSASASAPSSSPPPSPAPLPLPAPAPLWSAPYSDLA
jgi:hypothetical protein